MSHYVVCRTIAELRERWDRLMREFDGHLERIAGWISEDV